MRRFILQVSRIPNLGKILLGASLLAACVGGGGAGGPGGSGDNLETSLVPGCFSQGAGVLDNNPHCLSYYFIRHDSFGLYGSAYYAVARQPDTKMVMVGISRSSASDQHFLVARYSALGVLDTTFGTGGRVVTNQGANAFASGAALQTDGKIVAVGRVNHSTAPGTGGHLGDNNYDIVAIRYNSDGTIDTTFGTNGIVTIDLGGIEHNDWANAVAVQADGKIVLAGGSSFYNPGANETFGVVIRLLANGALDATFGSAGVVKTSLLQSNNTIIGEFRRLSIRPNGTILAVGTTQLLNSDGSRSLGWIQYRYLSDGTIDNTYGTAGTVQGPQSTGDANNIAFQPDGKLIILSNQGYVGRFNTNGSLDASFGTNGITQLNVTGVGDLAGASVQTDGSLLIGGGAAFPYRFYIVKLTSSGILDASFSGNGVLVNSTNPNLSYRTLDMTTGADGTVYAAGYYDDATNPMHNSGYTEGLLIGVRIP